MHFKFEFITESVTDVRSLLGQKPGCSEFIRPETRGKWRIAHPEICWTKVL